MQVHGGPMDGAYCGDCDLQAGILRRGIKSRWDNIVGSLWGWYDGPDPVVRVVYRLEADGKVRHLHSERLKVL
jgi:hypothetical protein